jgi:hypothetical protein
MGGGAGKDISIDCKTWRHSTPELIAEVMYEDATNRKDQL